MEIDSRKKSRRDRMIRSKSFETQEKKEIGRISTSFAYRFFHFKRQSTLRLVFDAAERNEKLDRIQCQRSKESNSKGKRKRRLFLCRRTLRVKVRSKVIPTRLLKNERREDVCWGGRAEKKGQLVALIGDQNPSPEAPSRSKRKESKKDVWRGATSRGTMEKSWRVSAIEKKEVRRDDSI